MPPTPAPLPSRLPDAFTVADALAAGAPPGRLRARDLEIPFRGVRRRRRSRDARTEFAPDLSPGAQEAQQLLCEIMQRVRDFALILPAGAFFSHATAAVVWGLPLPLRILRQVARALDVAVTDARRGSKAAGIAGHQLRSAMTQTRVRDGIPVTSPATTWALLGPLLSVDELIEVGDAVVHIPRRYGMQRGTPADALATIAQLIAATEAGRRAGAKKLRAALQDIRVGSASPGETRLRLALVRAGLPEPELDVDVYAADGTPIGFTELGYPRWRVLIEYEGDHHRVDRSQWNRDIEKHAACVDADWDPVRVTLQTLAAGVAVARVRAALVRGGWSPDAA